MMIVIREFGHWNLALIIGSGWRFGLGIGMWIRVRFCHSQIELGLGTGIWDCYLGLEYGNLVLDIGAGNC